MVLAALDVDVMAHSDARARSRATVSAYSLGRTLLVAVLVTLVPVFAVVAVSAASLTVPFLAGAVTAGTVDVAKRQTTTPGRHPRERATVTGSAD